MDINLYRTPKKSKSPVRSHLADLFESPSPQSSPRTWWPSKSLVPSSSRLSKEIEKEMELNTPAPTIQVDLDTKASTTQMDADVKAPTTPSRLLMLPLSSSPLDAPNDPIKSEIHDFASDEGHHTANSSPFDSDPEDDASRAGLESPFSRKLTSLLSPVMEHPEELFSHEQDAKSTLTIDNLSDSAHTAEEKSSMESDLIQLENEIATETHQEDEHGMASEKASPENSSLLDDNSVITTIAHDHLKPLVPSPKQEEPDLIDFTTPVVAITEEEMEAGLESEEEAQSARAEAKLLETDDEEDVGVVEKSQVAQEHINQPVYEAYGDMSELAVIMEEEEEALGPAHSSYANLAALQLENIRTEQLRQYQERQHGEIAPLSKSNSHESHKEVEQVDSAVGDDRSHASFKEDVDTSKALENMDEEGAGMANDEEAEDAAASHQFVFLSAKDKQSRYGGDQSLHLEEDEYSEYEDIESCLAATVEKDEDTTNANIDSAGKSLGLEKDESHDQSDSLQSGELPTQEHLKNYLATMKIPVEIGAETTPGDNDFVAESTTDEKHHGMGNSSTNDEATTNSDINGRQLSLVLPPTELRFTAESAMSPREESWYIRSPTDEQRQGLNLPTLPEPMHDGQQHASAQDVEAEKTTAQDYEDEAAMSTEMAPPWTLDLPPVTPAQKGSRSIFTKYDFSGRPAQGRNETTDAHSSEQRDAHMEQSRNMSIEEQLPHLRRNAGRGEDRPSGSLPKLIYQDMEAFREVKPNWYDSEGKFFGQAHHYSQQKPIDTVGTQIKSTQEVKAVGALPSPAGWWEITLTPAWIPSADILKPSIPVSPTRGSKNSLKSPRHERRWKNNKSRHHNRPYQRPPPTENLSTEKRAAVSAWRNYSASVEPAETSAFLAAQFENKRAATGGDVKEYKPVYHETFKQTAAGEKPGERRVVAVSKSTHTSITTQPKQDNNENLATTTVTEQPKALPVVLPPVDAPVLPEGEYDPWPTGLQEAVLARVSFISPTRSTFEGPITSASPSPVRGLLAKENAPFSPAVLQTSSQPTSPSPSSFRNRHTEPSKELHFNENALRANFNDEEEEDNNEDWSAVATVSTPEDSDYDGAEDEPLLFDHSESALEVKKRPTKKTTGSAARTFVKYAICLGVVGLLVWLGTSESARNALEHIRGYEVRYEEGRPKVMWKFGVGDRMKMYDYED